MRAACGSVADRLGVGRGLPYQRDRRNAWTGGFGDRRERVPAAPAAMILPAPMATPSRTAAVP